jgi:aromatic ring-opening dioxygenase catalytic subunit (LigB family)
MAGAIIQSVITPHTPRMGIEAHAPDFVRPLIAGARELGDAIRAAHPDALIINSTHWVCTFLWHVTRQAQHRGYAVADEAPGLIPGVPYSRQGDPELADAILRELTAADIPNAPNDSEHFGWDYGSWVPAHYLDPDGTIPVVLVGTVVMADLDECARAGAAIRRAVEASGRRAVFVASTALAHALVRGPERWPPAERMELDHRFIDMLTRGRIAEARAWFPEYAKAVVGEMGGRAIATMLATLGDEDAATYEGRQFGPYGQSSASGNTSLAVRRIA